jgi:hypothetical protein
MNPCGVWICVLGLTVAAIAPVVGQPVADAPKIVVGDRWEFKSNTAPGDKTGKWSREVVEVAPDGALRVRVGKGRIDDYDAAMNDLEGGKSGRARILVQYPIKVGDEWKLWQIDRKFENPNLGESGTVAVVAVETIAVPAGTFQCFRIEAKSVYMNRHNYTRTRHWKRWYCPDVKWIAKEWLETTVRSTTNPASSGTTTVESELVAFTPGK